MRLKIYLKGVNFQQCCALFATQSELNCWEKQLYVCPCYEYFPKQIPGTLA